MTDYIDNALAEARRDGFLLRRVSTQHEDYAPGCYFGGSPTMPSHLEWPYTDCYDTPPIPLQFIAQIDLASMPVLERHPKAPEKGTLFFFIEPKHGPAHEYASGTATVLWANEDTLQLPERKMPKFDLNSIPYGKLSPNYSYLSSLCAMESFGFAFEPRVSFDRHALFEMDTARYDALVRADELNAEEDNRLRQLQGAEYAPHSMFAGPASLGKLVDGEIIYETHLVPLFAIATDFQNGLSEDSEYVVFWISPDALAKGDFGSVFAFEGIV